MMRCAQFAAEEERGTELIILEMTFRSFVVEDPHLMHLVGVVCIERVYTSIGYDDWPTIDCLID